MQKNLSENTEALSGAPFRKLALKLCIPTIMIMLVTVIYHMADIFFIGRTGDPNQVAAVTLVSPMFSILSGLGVLLGTGGCTAISLALGQSDHEKIQKISAFCLYGSVGLGVIFAVVVLALLKPVCALLGSDAATAEFTAQYLRIIAIGAPVIMYTNVAPSLIRADGSTVNSMIGNMIGTVGNIVLDPILILACGWGVTGAAAATVIGNILAAVYYIRFIHTKGKIYAAPLRLFGFRREIAGTVLTLGLPMAVSTILQSVSSAVSNNLMMQYGAVAVSAQSVAGRIGMLITMTVMGICIGMQPAISYNYSAHNRARLTEILWKTTVTAVLTGTLLAAFSLIFRDPLLAAFLDDSEVLRIGRVCLLASVIIGPVYGFYQISTTYLQATGKAKSAITVSLLEKGIVYLPVLLIAHRLFGMYGLIFAGTVTTLLSMIVSLTFCYRTYREELRHESE